MAVEPLSSNPQCDNPQHYLIYADGQRDDSCVYCQVERLTAELGTFHRYYGGSQSLTVERNELIAERDRLRQALQVSESYVRELSDFRLQASRLRAALEGLLGNWFVYSKECDAAIEKAREALADLQPANVEDRPKDRPVVNAAYPIGYSEPHVKRGADETAETVPNADKVSVSRLSDETTVPTCCVCGAPIGEFISGPYCDKHWAERR